MKGQDSPGQSEQADSMSPREGDKERAEGKLCSSSLELSSPLDRMGSVLYTAMAAQRAERKVRGAASGS